MVITLRRVQLAVRTAVAEHPGSAPVGCELVYLGYDGRAKAIGRTFVGTVDDETAAERAFSAAEATGRRTWIDTPPVRGVQRGNSRALDLVRDDEP